MILDTASNWLLPLLVVGLLGGITLVFALFIGRWIDAQSNSVVDEPRKDRKSRGK
jgi:hypothetical protein